jgi:hypothetical protein
MVSEQKCESKLSCLEFRDNLLNEIDVALLGLFVVRVASHCDIPPRGFFAERSA